MKPLPHKATRTKFQHLTAAQVSETVQRSGLSRQDFAAEVGCGTSQLWKYEKEGLPPRMNTLVRAAILKRAIDAGVVAQNAAARAEIEKLSKGRLPTRDNSSDDVK